MLVRLATLTLLLMAGMARAAHSHDLQIIYKFPASLTSNSGPVTLMQASDGYLYGRRSSEAGNSAAA